MDEQKIKKTKQAIDKLIGYKVGDAVVITSDFTGETRNLDGSIFGRNMKRCWSGQKSIITAIFYGVEPTGYKLDDFDVYTSENFRKA